MSPFISVRQKKAAGGLGRTHFAVGVKVSKLASRRNRVKRRLRAAVRKLGIKPKPDTETFVMVTPQIADKSFAEIVEELERVFKKESHK